MTMTTQPAAAPTTPPQEGAGLVVVDDVLRSLDALPGQQAVLLAVASLCDDEDASLGALAQGCAGDPPFAARLLSLANSAYYGRRVQATSLDAAISTIGREALRSLALTTALGLTGGTGSLPPGFWAHASQVAAASSQVALALGARPGDAFCAGLLSDVGQALLLRAAPEHYATMLHLPCGPARLAAEVAWCGRGHAQIGAQAMAAMGLPALLCDAIAGHHSAGLPEDPDAGPLARAVHAGGLLARAVESGELTEEAQAELALVSGGALTPVDASRVLLASAAAAAALAMALG